MARAQIARDLTLARAIRPYADTGIVLLTGNGHVRKDIGVPFWLPADARSATISVAFLEPGAENERLAERYDLIVETPAVERPDPCEELRKRFGPGRPSSPS
jgi:uncharacterized iron-regulated protein